MSRRSFHGEPLTRAVGIGVVIEAVAVLIVGGIGVIDTVLAAQPVVTIVGLRLGPAHAAVVALTGVLGLCAVADVFWLRRFLTAQTIGYLIFAVVGFVNATTAVPDAGGWQLDPADHALHLGLFILGLIGVLVMVSTTAPTDIPTDRQNDGQDGSQKGVAR